MDGQPQEIRSVRDPVQELQSACDRNRQIIIASRVFPNEDYAWKYSKSDVAIVRGQLNSQDRSSEIKTVMTEKESRIVLVVSPAVKTATVEVRATVLKQQQK